MIINFATNSYHLEKINDYWLHVSALHLPVNYVILTDLVVITILSRESWESLCKSCFLGRSLIASLHNHHALGMVSLAELMQDESRSLASVELLEQLLLKLPISGRWEIEHHAYLGEFECSSFAGCVQCFPVTQIALRDFSKVDKNGKQNFFAAPSLANGDAQYRSLRSFMKNSFGLVIQIHEFEEGGLQGNHSDPEFIAALLTTWPHDAEHSFTITSGHDADKDRALLKAIMEYIERDAFKNQVIPEHILIDDVSEQDLAPLNINFCSPQVIAQQWVIQTTTSEHSTWLCGVDVIREELALVPRDVLYASTQKSSCHIPTSNGFAAHWSYDDALMHASLELIERDACMRWWFAPELAHTIVPNAQEQEKIATITALVAEKIGFEPQIYLLELSNKLQVPVIIALLTSANQNIGPALIVGSGAAFDVVVAVDKALWELKASVFNYIVRDLGVYQEDIVRQETLLSPDMHAQWYYNPACIKYLPFVTALQAQLPRERSKYSGPTERKSFAQYLMTHNMAWYALDVTPAMVKPFGVCVVRAIIPELYNLYFGFPTPYQPTLFSKQSVAGILPHCFS